MEGLHENLGNQKSRHIGLSAVAYRNGCLYDIVTLVSLNYQILQRQHM